MSERYVHIACGLDGSDASRQALAHAVRLRDQLGAGRLSLVHVVAPPVYFGVYYPPQDMTPPVIPEWLTQIAADIPDADVVLVDSASAYPPAEAARWSRDQEVDLFVVASHRAVFHRMTVGSFASYLAYHASCPVVVVPVHPTD